MKIRLIDIVVVIIVLTVLVVGGIYIKKKTYNYNYKKRISELTSDSVEVERKWLIDKDNIEYDLSNAKIYDIEQTYISFSPEIRIRRVNGNQYSFTVKNNMSADGLIRNETDFLITENDYNFLIQKKEANTIYKTRYKLLEDGQVIAIDIFKGDLEGLAYMEIEFANKDEANEYIAPKWIIQDVTDDIRYKNASLAQYGIPDENVKIDTNDLVEITNNEELLGL